MSKDNLQLPLTLSVKQEIESVLTMTKSNICDCSDALGEVVSLSNYASERKAVREAEEKEKIYQGILNRVKHLV